MRTKVPSRRKAQSATLLQTRKKSVIAAICALVLATFGVVSVPALAAPTDFEPAEAGGEYASALERASEEQGQAQLDESAQSGAQSGDSSTEDASEEVPPEDEAPAARSEDPAVLAAEAGVNDIGDLQAAIDAATEDTVITLGDGFPLTLPSTVNLTSNSDFAITIDGAGKTLLPPASGRHFKVTVNGAGSFTMRNMVLTSASGDTSEHGGLALTQQGTATVNLSELDFERITGGALALNGGGTGQTTISDSTFVDNTANVAGAFGFGRTAADGVTVVERCTFESNTGTNGAGYSGGAIQLGIGSGGNVTFADSAFIDNQFLDGGTHARGGAIAAHNSNVQLHLERDYFRGNSTASAGTPANADGGAVSVFNSTVNTTGSLFVSDSTFEGNTAQDDGAAIFVEGRASSQDGPFNANLNVENSTFINNVSGNEGGFDGGGAVQTSLRVKADFTHNTFVGNHKDNNTGVDIGGHMGFDRTYGMQSPTMTATNNIFTLNKSIDSHTKCYAGVGCSGIRAADEAQVLLDVFGTSDPAAAPNGSSRVAGDSRDGKVAYPVTTVAIAPPLSDTVRTAYQAGTAATGMSADQRGMPFKSAPDAGSIEMEFVKFDAATNGGSWSGLTPAFPLSGSSYFAGDNAATGWFEVSTEGQAVSFPTEPTPPAGKVFTGWFTQAVGGTEVTEAPLASGQTVYAQFGLKAVASIQADDLEFVYGNPGSLTATLSDDSATGVVTFSIEGTVIETVDVSAGRATLPASALAGYDVGEYSVSVAYFEDEDGGPVASTSATVTITPATTTTSLEIDSTAIAAGEKEFRVSGQVVGQYGTVPTGSVSLTIDGAPSGSPMALDSEGRYSGTVRVERRDESRQISLVATYSTDVNHLESSATKTADVEAKELPPVPPDPETPAVPVSPAAPEFVPAPRCGVEATVRVPATEGVGYSEVRKGTEVTVTATAADGYVIADGATEEWTFDVAAKECPVGPDGSGGLAVTGAEVTGIFLGALALLAGGVSVLVTSRKRKHASQ